MASKKVVRLLVSVALGAVAFGAAAAFAEDVGIGKFVTVVTGTFESVGKLMVAGAYLGGFGLTIAAIFKFKQHKDNPQQVQMGVPITMLLVGVALIFLPSIIQPAGESIFGKEVKTGGFSGNIEGLPKSN